MKRLHMTAAVLAAGACVSPPWPARTVALITGDRVRVGKDVGGHMAVTVEPADISGRHVVFSAWTGSGGEVRVVPSDMAPLLGSVLDEALFDVRELIRDGYDDAHAASLPLIVQHSGARSAALSGASVRTGRELTSIHATAIGEIRTKAAAGLGSALADAGRAALAHRAAAPVLGGALAGIQHVWLDGKVKATGLDWNLDKVNAPAAWSAGHTGKGVTVAVIDTGVDTTHPDLPSQVRASVNFSDAPDALDHFGHGTHVAGTIAGTGAASGGARRGVAFDARLLNVKVLNDQSPLLKAPSPCPCSISTTASRWTRTTKSGRATPCPSPSRSTACPARSPAGSPRWRSPIPPTAARPGRSRRAGARAAATTVSCRATP
ncbi:S8 family serine peptidase [Streptomyces sp. NPDC051917]|uniref:S8 family serine peptidase n=1 Tax=Streptomyces sp. NPDC051917 TaxID=3154754 RepID=UPI0034568D4D